MKKFLSSIKTVIVFFAVTVLSLGFYVYMIARPVSYGMTYANSSEYEGIPFEGKMKFYTDSTMLTKNDTFPVGMMSYYYYKDGYVFNLMAQTEAEYYTEVAGIDADFEGAVNALFYASEINAFRLVSSGPDGYTLVYTCTPAVVFAVVSGVVELALLGVSVTALTLYLKSKKEN